MERCTGSCNKKYCKKIISSCRPFNRTSKLVELEIYIHDNVTVEAPVFVSYELSFHSKTSVSLMQKFQLEIITFKKHTTTEYRPLLIKMKVEICKQLLLKNHPLFGFFGIVGSYKVSGNLMDPCPFKVRRQV